MNPKKIIIIFFTLLFIFIGAEVFLYFYLANSHKTKNNQDKNYYTQESILENNLGDCISNGELSRANGLTFDNNCLVGIKGKIIDTSENNIKIKVYDYDEKTSNLTLNIYFSSDLIIYKMNCGINTPCSISDKKEEVKQEEILNNLKAGNNVQSSLIMQKDNKIYSGRIIIFKQ